MTKKRAIVTGGSGFIGSHLAERLIQEGCEVAVLDNFSTGCTENLDSIRNHPRLSVHEVDILEISKHDKLISNCDWLFHLAGLADIVPSIDRPLDYHKTNVDGTVCLLEAARAAGVKKFLYAASSSCYGIPSVFPTKETIPCRPMYPYALTKYIGEQYVMHWSKVYRIPAVSLRLFNVYGPRSRTTGAYGAVFGIFLSQKLARKPYTVVGDGTQTRDFTFVTDVADAFFKTAVSEVQGEIFNVGSGRTYSINYLIELLGGPKEFMPKRPGEPDCTHADISKISKLVGWKSRVSFKEGVSQMIANIEMWKNAPLWDVETIQKATQGWFSCMENTVV